MFATDFNEDEFIGASDLNQLFDAIAGKNMDQKIKDGLIENVGNIIIAIIMHNMYIMFIDS